MLIEIVKKKAPVLLILSFYSSASTADSSGLFSASLIWYMEVGIMLFKAILRSEVMNENTAQWDGLVWLAENIKTIIAFSES